MSQATITATIGGVSKIIAVINEPTDVIASTDSLAISFVRPIRVDAGTAINLTTTISTSGTATASIGTVRHERPNQNNS